MDEGTTLADLLSLNLHEFEDEVRNIVDKAVKEMSMEKVSTRSQRLINQFDCKKKLSEFELMLCSTDPCHFVGIIVIRYIVGIMNDIIHCCHL